jgi:phospholipid transport system substrate-binding protein
MTGDKGRARMARSPVGWIAQALLALAMAGVAAGASPEPANSGGPATAAIQGTITEIIRLLEDGELKRPEMAEERRRLLERVAAARFNYAEMAKRSLGAHWRELTDAEREEFVALFQRLLVKTYARTIEGYAGQRALYLGERRAEDFAEVRTKIVSDKVETPVDFRLLRMRGDWWVYDVVVDGVGVVSNYRGQFARILRASSYADLVAQLRKKVETDPRPDRSSSLQRPWIPA